MTRAQTDSGQPFAAGVHMANGFDPARGTPLDPTTAQLIARRERVLGPSYRLFYQEPLVVESANSVWLRGADGKDYLDAYNNVPAIGHSHPAVTAAVTAQLSTLNTHTRYLTESILAYSERLLAKFPESLSQITYACTGSEAVDLAIRTARTHTGNTGLIISEHAYHGTTVAAAGISPSLGPNNVLGSDVVTIPSIDSARMPTHEIAASLLASVENAIAQLNERGSGVAAIIFDSIFSSDGVQPDPAGFLQPIVEAVHRAGGLYIADEVQPGFGRTDGWWGFERHSIVPDLVVLGKPMGNGLPISALVGKPSVLGSFGSQVRYFNTFGGNPVSIAAATAVLDVIEEDELITRASAVGSALLKGLQRIANAHDRVLDARGAGLFLAMEFASPDSDQTPDADLADRVVNGMRAEGVLLSTSGPHAAALKIRPPLPFNEEHATLLLEKLERVLANETRN
ncbi:aspartate aminotransferase family protein [Leucobacter sp. UT-8R-CII-1-4]|uniref:aspartate aminotransferase family protein n=1 Tax=Leucobacter sp. UT-8R-CII-1-4 TaxID=3040075 RepID=UPI0024A839AC|nr:aspartate aminotransferase family protein [Leucobacter sp. UT-8R-CII-1-4]MDI6023100.1 aspartate aminotransferase family protein [Leucobacter sp. UT-8R-CII-1-4]